MPDQPIENIPFAREFARLSKQQSGYGMSDAALEKLTSRATARVQKDLKEERNILLQPAELLRKSFQTTMQLIAQERPHRGKLCTLAIEIVCEHFGINGVEAFELKGSIIDPHQSPSVGRAPVHKAIPASLQTKVQKRRIINALIHGGGSSLDKIVHLHQAAIKEIDPSLFEKQVQHQALMNAQFFTFSKALADLPDEMTFPPSAAGGIVQVTLERSKVKVDAQAMTFVVLVHELAKGVIEALALVGREKDPETRHVVESIADDPRLEGIDVYVGRELWFEVLATLKGEDQTSRYQELQRIFKLPAEEFLKRIEQIRPQ